MYATAHFLRDRQQGSATATRAATAARFGGVGPGRDGALVLAQTPPGPGLTLTPSPLLLKALTSALDPQILLPTAGAVAVTYMLRLPTSDRAHVRVAVRDLIRVCESYNNLGYYNLS